MFLKKKSVTLLSTIILSLWSGIALAAKKTGLAATVSGWPLPIFLVGILIFRKKIFHGLDVPSLDFDEPLKPKQKTIPAKKVAKSEEKVKVSDNTENNFIDLTDDSKQCQASTSKGARCKRTNTLKNTTVTIKNISYQLITCNQHNNDKLKPYPNLIK